MEKRQVAKLAFNAGCGVDTMLNRLRDSGKNPYRLGGNGPWMVNLEPGNARKKPKKYRRPSLSKYAQVKI